MADDGLGAVWIPAGAGDPSPTGGPAGDDAPVVVVLHGRGDSAAGFTWMPEAFGTGYGYLLLNAPDEYFGGRSWYGFDDDRDPDILRSRTLLRCSHDDAKLHARRSPRGQTVSLDVGHGSAQRMPQESS